MTRNNFLEQLERRSAAEARQNFAEAETDSKPASEMTDDELQRALTESRRELLDAQHAEVRRHAKEQAGVFESPRQPESSGLAEILRTKNKRPHWRH
jgi:hypothetical protein